jgi:AcrR family transcriptional regulator
MVDGMEQVQETRKRVAPLPPEDRRAAIIEATRPLLEECGMSISTRQIAQAAGVAEGTLFRVFPDKASLIRSTVLSAAAPDEAIAALEAIPPVWMCGRAWR